MNSQIILRKTDLGIDWETINPYSEYGQGFYDGYNQTLAEVEKMIDEKSYPKQCFMKHTKMCCMPTDYIDIDRKELIKQLQKLKGEGK